MKNKRIEVMLTEDEWKFILWMAKRDEVSPMMEMKMMFQTELDQTRTLYEAEMEDEQ